MGTGGTACEHCARGRPSPECEAEVQREVPGYYRRHVLAAAWARREAGEGPGGWERRLEQLGVPLDVRRSLRGTHETLALTAAGAFVAERHARFLLLLGDRGVGKSVAAGHVLREFSREHRWDAMATGTPQPAVWLQASALTRVTAWDRADQELLRSVERAQLLVLDDLGDECTEVGLSLTRDALLERHTKARRTVLTSNLTPESFKARYGEALADRIRSSGMVPVLFGKSLRKPRPASAGRGAA